MRVEVSHGWFARCFSLALHGCARHQVQLTEEQVTSVMGESEFSEFFTKTTKTMELVLQANDEFDPTVDYT